MIRPTRLLVLLLLGSLAYLTAVGAATAQTVVAVTPTEIKMGNTNPYSGGEKWALFGEILEAIRK